MVLGEFSHRKGVAKVHGRNNKHFGTVPGVMDGIGDVTSEVDPCKRNQNKPKQQRIDLKMTTVKESDYLSNKKNRSYLH